MGKQVIRIYFYLSYFSGLFDEEYCSGGSFEPVLPGALLWYGEIPVDLRREKAVRGKK